MRITYHLIWMIVLGFPHQGVTAHSENLFHGMYLAVVQIDHTDTGAEAQVLFKVFADDLRNVIRAAYGTKSRPVELESFIPENEALIETYFQTHFFCKVNGIPATLKFESGSRENDVFWLKFTMQAPKKWQKVILSAPFFSEIYSTQSNIIHLLQGNETRFARLTKGADQIVFEF